MPARGRVTGTLAGRGGTPESGHTRALDWLYPLGSDAPTGRQERAAQRAQDWAGWLARGL